jgi:hypothetical protein
MTGRSPLICACGHGVRSGCTSRRAVTSIALIVRMPYDLWICRRKITTFEFGGADGGRNNQQWPADEAKSHNEAKELSTCENFRPRVEIGAWFLMLGTLVTDELDDRDDR